MDNNLFSLHSTPNVRWTLTNEEDKVYETLVPAIPSLAALAAIGVASVWTLVPQYLKEEHFSSAHLFNTALYITAAFMSIAVLFGCLAILVGKFGDDFHELSLYELEYVVGRATAGYLSSDRDRYYRSLFRPRTQILNYYGDEKKTVVTVKHWGAQILWYKVEHYASPVGVWDATHDELNQLGLSQRVKLTETGNVVGATARRLRIKHGVQG